MGKYKVCVYAICKNESQFAERWMASMSEADLVVVLDTGSEDDTVEQLRECGAQVTEEHIVPWRFDTARNRSLELVPEDVDICVCTDLDEVFRPGWRERLEAGWRPCAGQASYRYTWSFEEDGSEGYVFWIEKIHRRHGYRWTHPVHEVLEWGGEGPRPPIVPVEGVRLEHYPDPGKSRGQYLPLLELSVEEEPDDDRNMHYLGREYMYRGRWDDCIRTLKRHLDMPSATWADERAASMRYMARAYANKGEWERALGWYLRAVAQAPHLREPWTDLGNFLCERGEWEGVLWATRRALDIENRPRTYICEAAAWGSLPWDMKAIALYHTGRVEQALEAAREAARLAPLDKRLAANVEIIKNRLEG